jgi:hypothetical protein
VALGPLAPFFIEVRSWRHTGLTGEVGHYAAGNILAAIRANAALGKLAKSMPTPERIAAVIYGAVTDGAKRLR